MSLHHKRRRSTARERGTILLMVIAVLALMSIIAVVYVTIGQTDRRSAAISTREARYTEQLEAITDHFLSVIGDDVHAYRVERSGTAEPRHITREVSDYPHTAASRLRLHALRTGNPSPRQNTRIPAAGGAAGSITIGPRGAVPEGEFLVVSVLHEDDANRHVAFTPSGRGDDPWLASLMPTFLGAFQRFSPNGNAEESFLDNHDWLNISNFSPSGLFVNKFALRNNFAAEPGIGFVGAVGDRPRMSQYLTLNNPQGVPFRPYGWMEPNPTGATNDNPRLIDDALGGGNFTSAHLNVPADWTGFQRFAARPMNDLDPRFGPGDPRYLPYQWADADGDGIADSRWFELLGSTRLARTFPAAGAAGGPLRIFIAARAIDLSGLINVNTATDFAVSPDWEYPAGVNASNIDLRRLLRQTDFFAMYGPDIYDEDYRRQPLLVPGGALASDYNDFDEAIAAEVGDAAYVALRGALPRPAAITTVPPRSGGFQSADFDDLLAFTPEQRYEFFRDMGAAPRAGLVRRNSGNTEIAFSTPFTLKDEGALRARGGVPDPTNISRLESILGGRLDGEAAYSPFRSNRTPDLEVAYGAGRDYSGMVEPNYPLNPVAGWQRNISFLSPRVQLAVETDVRRLVTTVNGARPIRPTTTFVDAPANSPEPASFALAAEANRTISLRPNLPALLELATSGTDANARRDATNAIFNAYVWALAPNLPTPADPLQQQIWTRATNSGQQHATRFYGYRGPGLAVRTAAHMTANLIDMFDERTGVTTPSAMQVWFVSPSGRASHPFSQANAQLPRVLDVDFGLGTAEADVSRSRLSPIMLPTSTPDRGEADMMDVFGIEAQPVITEASTFTVYTNKVNGGTDNDDPPTPGAWASDGWVVINRDNPPAILQTEGRVRILGDVSASNEEFIMQVFAVQLHNAFDRPVTLNGYSVQFGNAVFDLGGGQLEAGETRVFYVTTPDIETAKSRFSTAVPGSNPDVNSWLGRLLGVSDGGGGGTSSEPRDRTDSRRTVGSATPVNPAVVQDLFAATPPEANRVVYLWRELAASSGPNNTPLRYLADRLRDPNTGSTSLDQRISGVEEVDEATGPFDLAQFRGANTGYTIALAGTIRRPDDPATGRPPLGAIPAYCIEVKHGDSKNGNETFPTGGSTSLSSDDFESDGPGGKNPGEWAGKTIGDVPGYRTIGRQPWNKSGTGFAVSVGRALDPSGTTFNGPEYDEVYPSIYLQDHPSTAVVPEERLTRARLTDVLLPLAIGPSWSAPSTGFTTRPDESDIVQRDTEWLTLGEALAVALDYDDFSNTTDYAGNQHILYRLGRDVLDRGQLRLDDFVPYIDQAPVATNYQNPRRFSGTGTTPDVVVGSGVPLALTILDQFSAGAPSTNPATRPVAGLLNINTAPVANLRLVPLFSPLPYTGGNDWVSGTSGEFGTTQAGGTNLPLYNPATQTYDVAATVAAYRDRLRVWSRNNGPEIDFQNEVDIDEPGVGNATVPARHGRTRISGIRETPGFAHIGEFIAANLRDDTADRLFESPNGGDLDNSILRFGDTEGTTPRAYTRHPGLTPGPLSDNGQPTANEVPDHFADALVIASAAANTITIRSDLFCVWFVVHGYSPADVQDLGENEPMVPSLARRYVMVVDRSNVVGPSDRPRILMLQEVR